MRILRFLRKELAAIWVLCLMGIAGAMNAAGWLRYGQTLSHMSGNMSKAGFFLAEGKMDAALTLLMILLCYFVGAVISGYAFPKMTPHPWRRAGLVLMSCGAMLILSELLPIIDSARMGMFALVLGAQNGMALRYRGLLIRTTHITGHLTDAGAALGRMLRSRAWEGEEMRFFLFSCLGMLAFLTGSFLGAYVARVLRQEVGLTLPIVASLCYVVLGLMTFVHSHQKLRD